MEKGIIYVCSTAVDGLIKIGRTKNFEARIKTLEDNGYRNVTGLKRQFAIEVENHEEIEQLLHDLFDKSRVGNTELFSLDLVKSFNFYRRCQENRFILKMKQSKKFLKKQQKKFRQK